MGWVIAWRIAESGHPASLRTCGSSEALVLVDILMRNYPAVGAIELTPVLADPVKMSNGEKAAD